MVTSDICDGLIDCILCGNDKLGMASETTQKTDIVHSAS